MASTSRLRVARHRRGWTLAELSKRSRVGERALGEIERGLRAPEPDLLKDLARALDFPVDFFNAPDLDEPAVGSATFRSMSRLSAGQRNAAIASATLAIDFARWLGTRYELPKIELDDLSGTEPEMCAELCRRSLGLGDRPIRNVVHLLERQGIRVFSLAEDCRQLDALSLWWDELPLVLLNTRKSAERSRFDAAHELGHLLMHRHGHGPCADPIPDAGGAVEPKAGRAIENEANDFASAFLLPKTALLASVSTWPSLAELIEVKRAWGVSLAALVYRLHALGAVSDGHYQHICIEMQRSGYRVNEPSPLQERETSQVLAKVFEDLRRSGISRADVARMLRWPRRELEGMLFGLAVSVVPGSSELSRPRGNLQIVK